MEGPENQVIYKFAEFRVDPEKRLLWQGHEQISLTPKVFETLLAFLEHPGEVLEKERLMTLLWADSFVEESNLTQNIAVLRKALGENRKRPRFIVTIPGRGYRFIAEVNQRKAETGPTDMQGGDATEIVEVPREAGPTRKTALFVPALAALLIILPAVGAWFYLTRLSVNGLELGRPTQITSWSGLDLFPALSPDGNTIAFSSDRNGSFEIFVKQLVTSAREIQITSDGGQNFQAAFSPDGSMIAYHSKLRGGISVIPATGGPAKRVSDFGSNPAWSPDGAYIAFQSDPLNDLSSSVRNAMPPSTLWIVPIEGGESRQITKPNEPAGGHGAPAWSPDGGSLVFDVNDWNHSSIAVVNVATGSVVKLDTSPHAAGDPVFSSDGKAVLFVADTGLSVHALPLAATGGRGGDPVKLFDVSGTRVRQVSVDSKGKRLVYSSLSTTSNIWASAVGDGKPNEPEQLTRSSFTRTALPFFSPDGKKLVYQSFTIGAISHLWTMDPNGANQLQLSSRPGFSSWWARDGSGIFFVSPRDNKTTLWSVSADASVERKLLDFDEEIYSVRGSPDNMRIVFASKRGGTTNLWTKPLAGGEPRQLTFDPEFAGFPCWSPDGKWIAYQIKRGDRTHAVVIPSDGGEPQQLESDTAQTWINDWSADSERIIFAGQRDGIWNIYSLSRVNGEQRQLTNFSKLNSFVRYPSWSPVNDRIAYEYAETTGNIWMAELK